MIPLNDLTRSTAALRDGLRAASNRVLDSGWFVLGPENEALESELVAYVGAGHVVTVGNGTDALAIAMLTLGLGVGSRVLTAANAGGYASSAARSIGAVPCYAEVDAETLLLSAATLEESVGRTGRVEAVVVTHLFGATADMAAIITWARRRGIPVIEDCAQALGARRDGRAAGAWGDIAVTSFYPTKNLGALGDGGAVLTSDADLARRARQLRQYGWESKYAVGLPGGRNSRMDELQAAFLRLKLPHLDAWNEGRRRIHAAYRAANPALAFVNTESEAFVAHLAVLQVPERDTFRAELRAADVATDVHYPIPDHRQSTYPDADLDLPVTQRAAETVVSIPLFPELTDTEVDRICGALAALDQGARRATA